MLRLLHPFSAVALIVGIVIGAGIFKTPSLVASLSGDAGWALVLWVTGALISIVGALCNAELCTAYPNAGGDYHFLHRAFGRNISFIYGWSRAMIINTGSIALLAFVFGDYISTLVSLGTYSSVIWALLVVVFLTAVNLAGIHASSRMQTWLTVTEIVACWPLSWQDFGSMRPHQALFNGLRKRLRQLNGGCAWFLFC
jgi:amino acid transporter